MSPKGVAHRSKWALAEGEFPVSEFFSVDTKPVAQELITNNLTFTCGNCSLVCTGDKKENLENLKLLMNSGCVIQYPDGSTKVLPPDDAEREFNRMDPEHGALYC